MRLILTAIRWQFFTVLLFIVLDSEAVQLLKSYQDTHQSENCMQSH